MRLLIIDPFKVILNTLEDCFCFAFAKSRNDPFNRIGVMFGYITRRARGNYIFVRIRSLMNQWDVMFLVQGRTSVKQRQRMPAVRAATMKIVQRQSPFFWRKSVRQIVFSGSPTSDASASAFGMIFMPFAISLIGAIFVFATIFSVLLKSAIRVFVIIHALPSPLRFKIVVSPLLSLSVATYSTCTHNAIATSFARLELGAWFPFVTTRANSTNGDRLINHCNLLQSRLGVGAGAAPRKADVRRVIKPSQARPYYSVEVA